MVCLCFFCPCTRAGVLAGWQIVVLPFTEPSPVHDLEAEYIGAEKVNLTWRVSDAASSSYTYRIEVAIVNGTFDRNLTSDVTAAEITNLIPGTRYKFTVFAVAADNKTEGEGLPVHLYTGKLQFLAALFLADCICCAAQGSAYLTCGL